MPKVTITLSDETLRKVTAYMDYMIKLNDTMSPEMKDPEPMTLELAIGCLIQEGLRAVEERRETNRLIDEVEMVDKIMRGERGR